MRTCVALYDTLNDTGIMMIIDIGRGRVAVINQDGSWEHDWEEPEDFKYFAGWEVFE